MAEGGVICAGVCGFFCFFLMHMIMIILGAVSTGYLSTLSLDHVDMQKTDWSTNFITSIKMKDSDERCEPSEFPMMNMLWSGTDSYCKRDGSSTVYKGTCASNGFSTNNKNSNNKYYNYNLGNAPILQNTFNGKKYCAIT